MAFKNGDYATRARVGGSGFTAYSWKLGTNGPQIVTFARQVSHVSPSPVGAGVVPIHPMDQQYPDHLITPQATSMGQITFELYELQTTSAFRQLPGLSDCNDLVEVFAHVADEQLSITKFIFNPGVKFLTATTSPATGNSNLARSEHYEGCVVANIMDGDQVEVGTMEVLKQVVVNYTKVTRATAKSAKSS